MKCLIDYVATEYLQRGEYNLFFVDWSILAPAPCYPSAAHNTRHAGKCIAQLIDRIRDAGGQYIHLIGFSLGAHVTNYAANHLKDYKLPRITGNQFWIVAVDISVFIFGNVCTRMNSELQNQNFILYIIYIFIHIYSCILLGLDPAMPLFITASNDNKLDPSDAAFVDVIHSNALVQGKIERCGHVDFYMNGGILQPGCVKSGTSK